MPHHSIIQPSLFQSERERAVRDMVELFRSQLATAHTPMERSELEVAIESWCATLQPPKPSTGGACSRSTRSSSPRNDR